MQSDQLVGIAAIGIGVCLLAVYFRMRARDRKSLELKPPKARITSSEALMEVMRRRYQDRPPATRMPEKDERKS